MVVLNMSFFNITVSNAEQISQSMPYLHSHDYYELYFQIKGSRLYFCNNKYFTITENTLIVTKPNVLHKFENGTFTHAEQGMFTRILIAVSASFFSPAQIAYLDALDEKAVFSLSEERMPDVNNTLNALLETNASVANDKQIELALYMGLLLYQIKTATQRILAPDMQLKNAPMLQSNPTILKIMDYINTNYTKSISLNELSAVCCLSKTWLCKCFFQAMHMTIFEYKLSLQINKAKEWLINNKYSMSTISKRLGFSSHNYFSSTFKKIEGITPLQYRKKHLPLQNNRSKTQ